MTPLGKATILAGNFILTASTLMWITTGNAEWFVGGGTIFIGALISTVVLSVETKRPSNGNHQEHRPTVQTYRDPPTQRELQVVHDDWTPPKTPPPDEGDTDPFFKKTTSET